MKMERRRVSRGAGHAGRAGRHSARQTARRQPAPAEPTRNGRSIRPWPGPPSSITSCLLKRPAGRSRPATISPSAAITPESIERFQLGYSPRRLGLDPAELPQDTAFTPAMLEKRRPGRSPAERAAAITTASAAGCCFRFSTRRAAPSAWAAACCPVAEPTKTAKYLNSPETPLFSKSNLLYGLNLARDAIRKTGTALVMEGYTDVRDRPSVRLRECRGRAGHGARRAAHSTAASGLPTAADRAGARRRRGRPQAGQRSARTVRGRERRPARADAARRTRPGRVSCSSAAREAFAALVDRRADALAHAVRSGHRGHRPARDTHRRQRKRWNNCWTRSPKRRGCATTRRPKAACAKQQFLQRLAREFRRARRASLRSAADGIAAKNAAAAAKPAIAAPSELPAAGESSSRWSASCSS